ncbi:MAG: RtcB family protein [Patescibacteria group bacterium]
MECGDFIKITEYLWEIPKSFRYDMRVPARIYATEQILKDSLKDRSANQLINLTTLPGIYKYAIAMPDIHEGYGFPIGGVAAMSAVDGVISPGGVGYDINCGVRLLRSEKTAREIKDYLSDLGRSIFQEVPSGVGRGGRLKLKSGELNLVLKKGAVRMIEMGYGRPEDSEFLESNGCLSDADPSLVSERAKKRGADQLGTMGAGNHFVEVGEVEEIFDREIAKIFGLFKGQATVLIHTGSRGLGHQIATDYIKTILEAMPKYGVVLPDRELAAVPFYSSEGQNYFKAMNSGANFAWANRQLITWEVREAWRKIFGNAGELKIVYDVAHNLAKIEEYDGKKLVIHRKGATRAFSENHPEIPGLYQKTGQPVLIPGSMGTASYVLTGARGAMENTFGAVCHGAGRIMSRLRARKQILAEELRERLAGKGIKIFTGSLRGLSEEAPAAYKDIDSVVEVVARAGIAKKVAKLKPLAVIKG